MKNIYEMAVKAWGENAQWAMVVEECGELISAVNKWHRGRIDARQLASEVADVEIMCGQARVLLGDDLVDAAKTEKLNRLAERLRGQL